MNDEDNHRRHPSLDRLMYAAAAQIECDVECHPQGVSHVASSAVSFSAMRYSILYLEGSHGPNMMSEVVLPERAVEQLQGAIPRCRYSRRSAMRAQDAVEIPVRR
jgi:hypothetical protein